MKKTLILLFLVLASPLSWSMPLMVVDFSDPSAVSFTATGANPIQAGGNAAFEGVTLIGLFSASTGSLNSGVSGTLTPNGSAAFNRINLGFFAGDDGLNLWCFLCSAPDLNFLTSAPAFTGAATVNLSAYSGLFRAVGTTGNISDDDGGAGVVIGEWEIVGGQTVPAPATLALFGLGLAGLGGLRRKKA